VSSNKLYYSRPLNNNHTYNKQQTAELDKGFVLVFWVVMACGIVGRYQYFSEMMVSVYNSLIPDQY
jgi:hypothetical protein